MRASFSVLLLLVLLSFCGGEEEPEAKVLLFKVGGAHSCASLEQFPDSVSILSSLRRSPHLRVLS